MLGLMGWPPACNSRASFSRLFDVHRSGHSGSPRVAGSMRASQSANQVGSVSTRGFRPAPGRRIRSPMIVSGSSSSAKPVRIAGIDNPVARDTRAMPPYPSAQASLAAINRRSFSSKKGASRPYFFRILSSISWVSIVEFLPLCCYLYIRHSPPSCPLHSEN